MEHILQKIRNLEKHTEKENQQLLQEKEKYLTTQGILEQGKKEVQKLILQFRES
jgi:flagellar motility protein MotE (MotC chaperone)